MDTWMLQCLDHWVHHRMNASECGVTQIQKAVVNHKCCQRGAPESFRSALSVPLQASNTHLCKGKRIQTQWSLQFNMNYLKQTLGSAGQPSVWRVFDDCVLLFQKVKIFKALLLFSTGRRAAAVGIHSALCFYTRGEVGQAHSHWNVFTGGRHSVDAIILLLCPSVLLSSERVNPFGWDVTAPKFDTWEHKLSAHTLRTSSILMA